MAITFHPDGRVEGSGASNFGSSGQIIQSVIGTNGYSTNAVKNLTGSLSNPTILDSNCTVAITPKRSNSKICIFWAAQIRVAAGSEGFVGVYYSPNSNMSSPTVVDKSHGTNNNLNESYRNNGSHNHWSSWGRMVWDETISNTNTRYYNVGGWAAGGQVYYGDNGVALQLMVQEIAS